MKESNLYFIDTNIFLRVLVEEDKKTFKECFQILKAIKEGKIRAFTASLILAEANWVLGGFYNFPKSEITVALKSILSLKGLKIVDKYNFYSAISLYDNFSIKFIDALIASHHLIHDKKSIIISYDKDFDKIGEVTRKEPNEILY
ncbi:PIN domain-containing protein [Patescibacteria group bacterium]|nr:PIN domain-containing protein [Patescibacteria group bacterium]MBU4481823.1 PIN domain-containing protein [Patescibacteria group bacterium]